MVRRRAATRHRDSWQSPLSNGQVPEGNEATVPGFRYTLYNDGKLPSLSGVSAVTLVKNDEDPLAWAADITVGGSPRPHTNAPEVTHSRTHECCVNRQVSRD
ncbi:hypothetical protein KM043_002924 [Ampulex compressa]|nr:hypothetical protein KM043_002924 [Ampulex compressa]